MRYRTFPRIGGSQLYVSMFSDRHLDFDVMRYRADPNPTVKVSIVQYRFEKKRGSARIGYCEEDDTLYVEEGSDLSVVLHYIEKEVGGQ